MEKRRLQATGGSSLTLTLPKVWLERVDLKSKDEVLVNAIGPVLVIKPANRSRQQISLTIGMDGKQPEWVLREMIGAYIAGADKIVLEAERITPEQNQIVRRTTSKLFGFEILEETSSFIVSHSIVDDTLFPVAESVRRVFAISSGMFQDALTAAQAGDKALAGDIIQRDQEVNKFVYAIKRRFIQISDGRADGDFVEVNYYRSVATQLERVGDRAVIISELASAERTEEVQLSKSFPKIRAAVIDLLQELGELIAHPTMERAHEILDRNAKLEPLMYSSKRMKDSYEGAVMEDSLDRLRGHLMNIAELTIDFLMQTS
jgi:phosphate uptake regulator